MCSACEQASHGGELTAAVAAGAVTQDGVTELGRVLKNDAEGRRSAEDTTLFDSTGLAIQDLAIARAACGKADELDLPGIELWAADSASPERAPSDRLRAGRGRGCDGAGRVVSEASPVLKTRSAMTCCPFPLG